MRNRITPELMSAILDAGYNIDYIDAITIDKLGVIPYPILVIPPTDRIPLSTYEKIASYAAAGKVIAIDKLPSLAPGLMEQGESAQVAALSRRLFRNGDHPGVFVDSVSELGDALHRALPPDCSATGEARQIGFIHRRLAHADLYFAANTGNTPVDSAATFRASRPYVEAWDPDSGRVLLNAPNQAGQPIPLKLAPYESRIFVFADQPGSGTATAENAAQASDREVADLSQGWSLRFPAQNQSAPLTRLQSWTDLPQRQYFSGEADYTRSFKLAQTPPAGTRVLLDFGEGAPIADDRPPGSNGMHALLDPPIREAAIVFVNGQRAGSLWHPPYRIDISQFAKKGENEIEVKVFNTAINELAGQPPRDYTALWAKYGKLFDPQDMQNLRPVPSGLLGPIHLLEEAPK
jgi:hypothetical protein